MKPRTAVLRALYCMFPFPLTGDLGMLSRGSSLDVSCIINFHGRIPLLEGILFSLAGQDLQPDRFEVLLVEDRGGSEGGQAIGEKFSSLLGIRYFALDCHYGRMGHSRNYALERAGGRIVLFLDDDTVILQQDFLSKLIAEFQETGAEAIVPHGTASYCLPKERYGFHDPYFPSNRCMAYRREVLIELEGFVSDMVGQEDVEFVVRFLAAGKEFVHSDKLHYFHPPLLVHNLNKAAAVGASFAALRRRYPRMVWLLLMINGMRWLPLGLMPVTARWRMQGRFSRGFLQGAFRHFRGMSCEYAEPVNCSRRL